MACSRVWEHEGQHCALRGPKPDCLMPCWPVAGGPLDAVSSACAKSCELCRRQSGGARGEFRGELRDYQREGLGWLDFLQRFGFGGCLADDMGLGKTIQVLALLESRRELAPQRRRESRRRLRWSWCRARWSFIGRKRPPRFAPKLRFSITPELCASNPANILTTTMLF